MDRKASIMGKFINKAFSIYSSSVVSADTVLPLTAAA
jgi:hypothetical protein